MIYTTYIDIPYIVYIYGYIYSPLGRAGSSVGHFLLFFSISGALGSESRDGCRGLLVLFYCWLILMNWFPNLSHAIFWNIWIGYIMMIEQLFMFLVLFVSICKYDSPYFMFFGMWIDLFFQGGHAVGKNPTGTWSAALVSYYTCLCTSWHLDLVVWNRQSESWHCSVFWGVNDAGRCIYL